MPEFTFRPVKRLVIPPQKRKRGAPVEQRTDGFQDGMSSIHCGDKCLGIIRDNAVIGSMIDLETGLHLRCKVLYLFPTCSFATMGEEASLCVDDDHRKLYDMVQVDVGLEVKNEDIAQAAWLLGGRS